jgi:hypothetical protein
VRLRDRRNKEATVLKSPRKEEKTLEVFLVPLSARKGPERRVVSFSGLARDQK